MTTATDARITAVLTGPAPRDPPCAPPRPGLPAIDVSVASAPTPRSLRRRTRVAIARPGLRQAAMVVADQSLFSLVTFVTGVLVARACGENHAAFGHFVLGTSLVITGIGLQRALVSLPFTVSVHHVDRRERAAYTGSTWAHELFFCGLVAIALLIAAAFLFTRGADPVLVVMLAVLAPAMTARLVQDFVRSVLLADLRIRSSLIVGLIAHVLTLLGLGWAYWRGWLTVSTAYAIPAACAALPTAILLWRIRGEITMISGRVLRDLVNNLRIARWIVASNLLYPFTAQALPWLLVGLWGSEPLAMLGVCKGTAGLVRYLGRGLQSFLLPKLSSEADSPERLRRLMAESAWLLAAFGAMYVVLGWFCGDWLIPLLYSDAYTGLGGILVLCFADAALSLVTLPIDTALHAMRRSDVVFRGMLASVPVLLGVGVVLTWKYGLWGVCIAALAGTAVSFAYKLRVVVRNGPTAPMRPRR